MPCAASNCLVETTMLPLLPSEILDLIVDHLHDEPITLESCCLASKSWVPRARRYLFALVEFISFIFPIQLWVETFPDPANSPGRYTRCLQLGDLDSIVAACTVVPHFRHVEELQVSTSGSTTDNSTPPPSIQLRRMSPTLKTLHVSHVTALSSELLNLICSFPLLENLGLYFVTTWGGVDGRYIPPPSPTLTEFLYLTNSSPAVTHGLLNLLNGPHSSRIKASFTVESARPIADLISKCSDSVEYLALNFDSPSSFPLVPIGG